MAETLTAMKDTPASYMAAALLANDVDVDEDELAIATVTAGTGGTVALDQRCWNNA